MKIGVVVGRFQVPELTAGHQKLLSEVRKKSEMTLVFLGVPQFAGPTRRNPLDYNTRRAMVDQAMNDPVFGIFHIEPIVDMECDDAWSEELDRRISVYAKPGDKVTLYGSTDSFVDCYSGKYDTAVLDALVGHRGTKVREMLRNDPCMFGDKEFRAGIIYATQNSYPTVSSVVDIAITRDGRCGHNKYEILLGAKASDGDDRRFPGGFVDLTDLSLEIAASRELREETSLIIAPSNLTYISSGFCNDWRIKGDTDRAMCTSLFHVHLTKTAQPSISPGDDLSVLEWMSLDDAYDRIISNHLSLLDDVDNHLRTRAAK